VPPSDAGAPADAAGTARIIAGIRRISDTELEVTAASRDLFLASGGSSGRFIPVMRDGGAAGVRMFALRKDGVLAALGLKNGDTLLSVNGQPIAGPDQALEVYAKTRRAERVALQIERDGKPMEIVVRIVPALGKGPAKR
jgi:S1-C subfamily serine protease